MYKISKIITSSEKENISKGKVLVIYTGGTLGMIYDKESESLIPFDFKQIPENMPEISRFNFEISVITFDTLLDSSNMKPQNWVEIAEIIEEYYQDFDSFVVLHGTDTMAYTASAISFMLIGLAKPVVFTGSQLPIGIARTDAKENFITALEISLAKKNGQPTVPEVCIYFNSVLLRGNRSRKHESQQFDAFSSENYPNLATVGVTIDFNFPYIRSNKLGEKLKLHKKLNENVAILKLFPGITENLIQNILATKNLKGVVLETFGAGNAPTDTWFFELIEKAIQNEIFIVNISQCIGGSVTQGNYETSHQLSKLGVLSGADLTTEAAICKLMVVLGMELDFLDARNMFSQNFAGEFTTV